MGACTSKNGPASSPDASFEGLDGTTFDAGGGDGEPDATEEAASPESSTPEASPSDGGAPDAPAPACNPNAPFGTPTLAPYPVDPTATDYSARLSVDELTLYLMRSPSGMPYGIQTATRASATATFGALSPLAGVAFGAVDVEKPTVTADQLTLYVDSHGPPGDAGSGPSHVWSFTRASTTATFASAGVVDLGASGADDIAPFLMPDGQTLYFSSDRGASIEPYVATQGAGGAGTWNAPTLIAALDSPGFITFDLSASADGLTLYFASNRSGDAGANDGDMDVWVSRRASTSAAWGAPVHVDELATPGNDEPSWTSADGCTLWFSSAGPFGDASAGSQAIRPRAGCDYVRRTPVVGASIVVSASSTATAAAARCGRLERPRRIDMTPAAMVRSPVVASASPHAASAASSSRALWKRRSGSFSRHRITTASRSRGTWTPRWLGRSGISLTWASMTAAPVGAVNGGQPVSMK
jgi:hypothetical protein